MADPTGWLAVGGLARGFAEGYALGHKIKTDRLEAQTRAAAARVDEIEGEMISKMYGPGLIRAELMGGKDPDKIIEYAEMAGIKNVKSASLVPDDSREGAPMLVRLLMDDGTTRDLDGKMTDFAMGLVGRMGSSRSRRSGLGAYLGGGEAESQSDRVGIGVDILKMIETIQTLNPEMQGAGYATLSIVAPETLAMIATGDMYVAQKDLLEKAIRDRGTMKNAVFMPGLRTTAQENQNTRIKEADDRIANHTGILSHLMTSLQAGTPLTKEQISYLGNAQGGATPKELSAVGGKQAAPTTAPTGQGLTAGGGEVDQLTQLPLEQPAAEPQPTRLSAVDERAFRASYAEVVRQRQDMDMPLNANADDPLHHYDYRAEWLRGGKKLTIDESGHFNSGAKGRGHPREYLERPSDGRILHTVTGRQYGSRDDLPPGTIVAKDDWTAQPTTTPQPAGGPSAPGGVNVATSGPYGTSPYPRSGTGAGAEAVYKIGEVLGPLPTKEGLAPGLEELKKPFVMAHAAGTAGLSKLLGSISDLFGPKYGPSMQEHTRLAVNRAVQKTVKPAIAEVVEMERRLAADPSTRPETINALQNATRSPDLGKAGLGAGPAPMQGSSAAYRASGHLEDGDSIVYPPVGGLGAAGQQAPAAPAAPSATGQTGPGLSWSPSMTGQNQPPQAVGGRNAEYDAAMRFLAIEKDPIKSSALRERNPAAFNKLSAMAKALKQVEEEREKKRMALAPGGI